MQDNVSVQEKTSNLLITVNEDTAVSDNSYSKLVFLRFNIDFG